MGRPRLISDEEILKVARECFMDGGLGVSTQTIADHLGISQPAIFKRFGTKEELFLAALAPPERIPVLDWVDSAPGPGPFRPQLQELLEKLWESLQWIIPRMMVLHTCNIDPATFLARYKTPPLLNVIHSVSGFLKRARDLGQVRSDGDTDAWAMNVLGTLQGRAVIRFVMRSNFGPEEDAEYLASTVELLFRGMAPEEKETA